MRPSSSTRRPAAPIVTIGTIAPIATMATICRVVVRTRRLAVAAVASHRCLPPSVSVTVTKLAEFRVQTAARVKKWLPTVSARVDVFMAVEVMSPFFSGSGAGGRREKAAPGTIFIVLKRGADGENLRITLFF